MFYIKEARYHTKRHSCFLLRYHLVLATKGCLPMIVEPVKTYLYSVIRSLLEERNIQVLELNGAEDHIEITFETEPFVAPGELVNVLKTQSSRKIRKTFGTTDLAKYYDGKSFAWEGSYLLTTVGNETEEIAKEYLFNVRRFRKETMME